jgi:hypothetical protein
LRTYYPVIANEREATQMMVKNRSGLLRRFAFIASVIATVSTRMLITPSSVLTALVAVIHDLRRNTTLTDKSWMAGTRPAKTEKREMMRKHFLHPTPFPALCLRFRWP